MKLFKKIGLVSLVLLLGATMAACNKNNEQQDNPPQETIISVSEVLAQNNNADVCTKGVVFAKTNDGIYINDGETSLFVLGGLDAKVKDEVKVNGKFALVNKMPEIKNATVTVLESNKAELQPVEKTVADIVLLDENEKTNYGQYYTIEATITKNTLGQYSLVSEGSSVFVNDKSNVTALNDWIGKNVYIDVVTTSKTSEGWSVSYCKSALDIREIPVDLDEVKLEILQYVQDKLQTNVYGILSLVKKYNDIPNVTLTWSVKEPGTIAISNNEATVTIPETDTQVTLVLTLSNGVDQYSEEFVVTNKAVRTVALKDIGTTSYEEDENFFVEGKVVLTTCSNGSIYSNILVDSEGQNFARLDSDEETCKTFTVGDELKALVKFEVSNGVQCVDAYYIEKTKASESTDVDWSSFACTELVNENDYAALADAMDSENGTPLKLFKVVNPYITTSATSGWNYYRFGSTPETAKTGVIASDKVANTASISLKAINFTVGDVRHEDLFTMGNFSEGAIKNVGLTMYMFCAFNIENKTCGQFVFAQEGLVKDLQAGINVELEALAQTVDANEAGVLELPTEIGGVSITWQTNHPNFDLTTGEYPQQDEKATYKFIATYKVGEQDLSKEIEITFDVAPAVYLSVSDFNDKENGNTYNVEGTIIGFGTRNYDENNKMAFHGFYISDGSEIVYVNENGLTYDSSLANAYEMVYTYGTEKTPYQVGDFVQIKKAAKTGKGIDCFNSKIIVTPKNDVVTPMVFNPTEYETVSSKADMAEVFAKGTNILVKVVATAENPLCLGCSTITKAEQGKDIYNVNKIRIFFLEGATSAPGTTAIKVDGTHTCATKAICSEYNLGSRWWKNLGSDSFDFLVANTNVDTQFVGSFYMVLNPLPSTSASFYMVTILAPGFDLAVKA